MKGVLLPFCYFSGKERANWNTPIQKEEVMLSNLNRLLRYSPVVPALGLLLWITLPAFTQQPALEKTSTVVEGRSALAISYPEGPTLGMKFKGTHRLPNAKGEAKVERKRG